MKFQSHLGMRYVVCTCPSGDRRLNEVLRNVFEDFMLIRGVCPSADHVSGFNLRLSLSLSVGVIYEKEG